MSVIGQERVSSRYRRRAAQFDRVRSRTAVTAFFRVDKRFVSGFGGQTTHKAVLGRLKALARSQFQQECIRCSEEDSESKLGIWRIRPPKTQCLWETACEM
jgi:ribosomal protein L44E